LSPDVKALWSVKTSGSVYWTTQRNIPKDLHPCVLLTCNVWF
jgi:hypothetical protein